MESMTTHNVHMTCERIHHYGITSYYACPHHYPIGKMYMDQTLGYNKMRIYLD